MQENFKYFPFGDNGIVVEAGSSISKETHYRVKGLLSILESERAFLEEIQEIVPTYTTLLILYNPMKISYQQLKDKLISYEKSLQISSLADVEVIHVPVLYGGEMGPDLKTVAEHNKLSMDEVIATHTAGEYLIYMLGFTPGFPYLGGMAEDIATPRLEKPREKISAGSVGIAGSQTGIYPIDSPGGWQIIARTPLKLFDPYRDPAVLFKAGQYIKFEAITSEEYKNIEASVLENTYKLKISSKKGNE